LKDKIYRAEDRALPLNTLRQDEIDDWLEGTFPTENLAALIRYHRKVNSIGK